MTEGLKIRADIDTENVKGLLLLNGGAAVALLTFLPNVLDKANYEPLAWAILWGLLIFQVGLIFAITHNRLRRKCSLLYEGHDDKPPPCEILGFKLMEPCICCRSIVFMWLSVAAFFGGGISVFVGGFESLNVRALAKQEVKTVPVQQVKPSPNTVLQGIPASGRP